MKASNFWPIEMLTSAVCWRGRVHSSRKNIYLDRSLLWNSNSGTEVGGKHSKTPFLQLESCNSLCSPSSQLLKRFKYDKVDEKVASEKNYHSLWKTFFPPSTFWKFLRIAASTGKLLWVPLAKWLSQSSQNIWISQRNKWWKSIFDVCFYRIEVGHKEIHHICTQSTYRRAHTTICSNQSSIEEWRLDAKILGRTEPQ